MFCRPGSGAAERLPRLAAHDHRVARRQRAKALQVVGQPPGQRVAAPMTPLRDRTRRRDAARDAGRVLRAVARRRRRCHNARDYNGRPLACTTRAPSSSSSCWASCSSACRSSMRWRAHPVARPAGDAKPRRRCCRQRRPGARAACCSSRRRRSSGSRGSRSSSRTRRCSRTMRACAQEFLQTTQQLSLLPLEERAARRARPSCASARTRSARLLKSPQRAPPTSSTKLADGYAQLVENTQGMLNATDAAHAARDRAPAGDRGAGPREVALPGARHRRASRSRSRSFSPC